MWFQFYLNKKYDSFDFDFLQVMLHSKSTSGGRVARKKVSFDSHGKDVVVSGSLTSNTAPHSTGASRVNMRVNASRLLEMTSDIICSTPRTLCSCSVCAM